MDGPLHFMVLGVDAGKQLVEEKEMAVYFIFGGDHGFEDWASTAFKSGSVTWKSMIEYVFAVLGIMLLFVTLMSVGVLLGRKPISGSCGGMRCFGMDVARDICKGDKSKCVKPVEGS